MRKPNILFVMADQLSAPVLPFHGNPAVKAPHLQALAERSAVFENAYCNFPLCAPARFSLLAGQFATRIGAFDNACEFQAATPTLPYYLAQQGYKTILSGKMHFVGPDQKHGFEERLTTDIYPADFGWVADWKEGEFSFYSPGHNLSTVDESGSCFRSLQLDYDEEVEAKAIQRLYDLAREDEQPFFMCVSYTHPHPPYHIPPEYLDRYSPEEINLPIVGDMPMQERDKLSQWVQYSARPRQARARPTNRFAVRATPTTRWSATSTTRSGGCWKRSSVPASTTTRSWCSPPTTATCWANAACGSSGCSSTGRPRFPCWSSIRRAPKPRRIAEPVSHVDLLPTLLDYATERESAGLGRTDRWPQPRAAGRHGRSTSGAGGSLRRIHRRRGDRPMLHAAARQVQVRVHARPSRPPVRHGSRPERAGRHRASSSRRSSPSSRRACSPAGTPRRSRSRCWPARRRRKFINSLPDAIQPVVGLPGQHRRHAPLRAARQCPGDQGQEALAAACRAGK